VSEKIRVAVAGAGGRLGTAIVARLEGDERFEVAARLERPGSSHLTGDTFTSADGDWNRADVLIDASLGEAVAGHAERAASDGVALLVAVTGLDEKSLAVLDGVSERIPVLVAPNLSLGVTMLVRLVRQAARSLAGFDLEISEIHHSAKRDSPSGTAAWLGREAAMARGWEWPEVARYGRQGAVGPRSDAEIGVHSIRAGSAAGEHRVQFGGSGEHLELTHVAESRDCFAAGALEAVSWLAGARPGRYNMEDVIDGR
jgi:4-hydroxy-tetrahydrodipicolinate reductase